VLKEELLLFKRMGVDEIPVESRNVSNVIKLKKTRT